MPVQLLVGLLHNRDGEWVEPQGCCYQRQLVDFECCPFAMDLLQGMFTFQCYREPHERPGSFWIATHVGVLPMVGLGDSFIAPLHISETRIVSGKTIHGTVRVPASFAAIKMPLQDPSLW